jgi:hypothetical protein
MTRRFRILVIGLAVAAGFVVAAIAATYSALRQVRPFYEEAIQIEPEALARGRQELESRATTLYTDSQEPGTWSAIFTDDQINGWLAGELAQAEPVGAGIPAASVRAPRIAITPGHLSLGFTTSQGRVETVVSVDASVALTHEGDVAIRLEKVQAGSLPLPAAMVAEKIAAACRDRFTILWTEQGGQPVAVLKIHNDVSSTGNRLTLDSIELRDGELYVSGHTEETASVSDLHDFELHLAPKHKNAALEIARRGPKREGEPRPVE